MGLAAPITPGTDAGRRGELPTILPRMGTAMITGLACGLIAARPLQVICAGLALLLGATVLLPRDDRFGSASGPGPQALTRATAEMPDHDCTGARDQLLAYRAPDATAPLGATMGAALRGEPRSYPARAISWDAPPGAGGICDVRMTRWIGNELQTLHWQVTIRLTEPVMVDAQDALTKRLSGW